jgi:hypothetical protein
LQLDSKVIQSGCHITVTNLSKLIEPDRLRRSFTRLRRHHCATKYEQSNKAKPYNGRDFRHATGDFATDYSD